MDPTLTAELDPALDLMKLFCGVLLELLSKAHL